MTHRKKPNQKLHAFTLIELLVVISIIALLIAMLLPVLSKAKAAARVATCMSNLRQNGIAFRSYADEFKGWLPFPTIQSWMGPPIVMDGGRVYNQGLLYPYLNSTALTLFCPDPIVSDPNWPSVPVDAVVGAEAIRANYPNGPDRLRTSYGMPMRWEDPSNTPQMMIAAGTAPPWMNYDIYTEQYDAFIALKLDYNAPPLTKNRRTYPIMACLQEWFYPPPTSFGCHNGELSNVVFPDGRVMSMKYDFRAGGYGGGGEQIFGGGGAWGVLITMYR